jgi:hypothetical protein
MAEIVKIWKENNVDRVEFEFSCGGDSMNDTSILIYDKEDNLVSNTELVDYFEDEVYRNVNFYEASDGHYIGESGTVTINLECTDDGNDNFFSYTKSSESEFCERHESVIKINLNDDQLSFVKDYVSNFVGSQDDNTQVNYSTDFVMTDERKKLCDNIINMIDNEVTYFKPDDAPGELTEWFTFESDGLDGSDLIILHNNEYYDYQDGDYETTTGGIL